MGKYDETVEVPRRTMVLFFVIDTSGSMSDGKIGKINDAINQLIPDLKKISEDNADAQIKVATLAFSSGARWMTDTPEPLEIFEKTWHDLDADGLTDLGAACTELNEKLSRKAFMSEVSGSFAPVIILMSDGSPTDDYAPALEKLKQNNWFKAAIKVAFAVGEDANQDVLVDFTCAPKEESIITVKSPHGLEHWIRFVTITASKIGSKSSSTGSGAKSKQEELVEALEDERKKIIGGSPDPIDIETELIWEPSEFFDDGVEW